MKYLFCLIPLFLVSTSSSAQLLWAQINDPDGYTNVRSGPGTQHPIVGQIQDGVVFGFMEEQDSNWWRVSNQNVRGYMHRSRIDQLLPSESKRGEMVPASYYLNHPDVSESAKAHYRGEFKVSDDNKTFALLDEVTRASDELRPFYILILFRITAISDGALSEVMGGYVSEYLAKYPAETMRYFNCIEYRRYKQYFIEFAAFSEMDFDYEDPRNLKEKMLEKCQNCAEKEVILQFLKYVKAKVKSYGN